MATGIILGFFTGYFYGTPKPDKNPSKITRLNYSIIQSLLRYQGYNKEDILKLYQSFDILKNSGISHDSLIRSMPFSFLDDINIIVNDTNLTNPNPINRDAGLLYVLALKLALQKKNPTEILNILQSSAQTSEIQTVLLHISQGKFLDMENDDVITAFYAAIAPFLQFQNWTDGVEWVTQLGGNQAVNAALAGSLLGAYFEPKINDKQILLLGQFPKIYEIATKVKKEFSSFVSDQSRQHFLAYGLILKEMDRWVQQSQWNFFESNQDYISIIFPDQENQEFKNNKDFIQMMRTAFKDMMAFYGLVMVTNRLNIFDKDRFITYFVQGGSEKQNHTRIAKILTSLKLFDQVDLYLALKEVTNQVAEVSSVTKQLWNNT